MRDPHATVLEVFVNGEGAIPALGDGKPVIRETLEALTALPHGMSSGKPSVAFFATLSDGTHVMLETSLANLQLACAAFHAAYGDVTGPATAQIRPGPEPAPTREG